MGTTEVQRALVLRSQHGLVVCPFEPASQAETLHPRGTFGFPVLAIPKGIEVFTGRMPFLWLKQQCQSVKACTCFLWRHINTVFAVWLFFVGIIPKPTLEIKFVGIWTVTISLTPGMTTEPYATVQYYITCSPAKRGKAVIQKLTEKTLVTLNNLNEDTIYHIYIKARYKGGKYGDHSHSLVFRTNPGRRCFKHAPYMNLLIHHHYYCSLNYVVGITSGSLP